jgi:hypothetical protein
VNEMAPAFPLAAGALAPLHWSRAQGSGDFSPVVRPGGARPSHAGCGAHAHARREALVLLQRMGGWDKTTPREAFHTIQFPIPVPSERCRDVVAAGAASTSSGCARTEHKPSRDIAITDAGWQCRAC